jgi:hypothetical protein
VLRRGSGSLWAGAHQSFSWAQFCSHIVSAAPEESGRLKAEKTIDVIIIIIGSMVAGGLIHKVQHSTAPIGGVV